MKNATPRPNTFCCDIAVTEEGKTRCVQTGDHASTDAEALANGCFTAYRYYVQDRPELESATVTLCEVCGTCGGSGVIQGKRYRQTPCKQCKTRGSWPLHIETIARPEASV